MNKQYSTITGQLLDHTASFKRINLTRRQMCDLELLLNGAFSPLQGFMVESDYISVIETMRLENGDLWPIPIILDVPSSVNYSLGETVILLDEYGNPVAFLDIESIFSLDKQLESKKIYKTLDQAHQGVYQLVHHTHSFAIGGRVGQIAVIDHFDFHDLRLSPQDTKEFFIANKWNTVIAFQTRNPLHRAHYELIRSAQQEYCAKVLLHPVVGMTKYGDIDYVTRVKSYKKLYENYMRDFTLLAVVPLAMRMAGPREAVWHALIRRNYGATHMIVGRDHAGPGVSAEGILYYEPLEAQELAVSLEAEIGIKIIPFNEMVYDTERKAYFAIDKISNSRVITTISGTQFRDMICNDSHIPEWFSFPEVIDEIKKTAKLKHKDGLTIFFTGLSGAGKSTISRVLFRKLTEMQDKKISYLDGDVIRNNISKGLTFSKEDRIENILRIGFIATEITKHGGIAICAAISPYESARYQNRIRISEHGKYVEVYVNTPLDVCQIRDVKGLYSQASLGVLTNMTGVTDPYEVPASPDVIVDTVACTAEENATIIIEYLKTHRIL